MNRMKLGIGITIILLAIFCISIISIENFSVYFYTPEEAIEKAATLQDQKIRVGGMVTTGSIVKTKDLGVQFEISNLKSAKINVHYRGTLPDMFKEGSGVIAEGFISKDGSLIKAATLIVKHSEEYKVPKDIHSSNTELLKKSMYLKEE